MFLFDLYLSIYFLSVSYWLVLFCIIVLRSYPCTFKASIMFFAFWFVQNAAINPSLFKFVVLNFFKKRLSSFSKLSDMHDLHAKMLEHISLMSFFHKIFVSLNFKFRLKIGFVTFCSFVFTVIIDMPNLTNVPLIRFIYLYIRP